MIAPASPVAVSQNPPVRTAARGSGSRSRCWNRRCTSRCRHPTATRSSDDRRPTPRPSSSGAATPRSATSATDWIDSWISETQRVVRRDREAGDDRLVHRGPRHQRALERQRDVRRREQQPGLIGTVTERARDAAAGHRPGIIRGHRPARGAAVQARNGSPVSTTPAHQPTSDAAAVRNRRRWRGSAAAASRHASVYFTRWASRCTDARVASFEPDRVELGGRARARPRPRPASSRRRTPRASRRPCGGRRARAPGVERAERARGSRRRRWRRSRAAVVGSADAPATPEHGLRHREAVAPAVRRVVAAARAASTTPRHAAAARPCSSMSAPPVTASEPRRRRRRSRRRRHQRVDERRRPVVRAPRGVAATAAKSVVARRDRRGTGVASVDPVQPPLRCTAQLAGEAAEQLAGELARRRDPGQLVEEDRRVGRGGEAGRHGVGEQRARSSMGEAARPSQRGGLVDVVELAAVDRRQQASGAVGDRVEARRGRRGDGRSERLVLVGDREDPQAGRLACCRRAPKGRSADPGGELERRVQHERVGRVDARDGDGPGHPRRELEVGEAVEAVPVVGGAQVVGGRRQPVVVMAPAP